METAKENEEKGYENMDKVTIQVNGNEFPVRAGSTILDATFEIMGTWHTIWDVRIPTLYYLKGVNDVDRSGVCVAEADGKLVNASTTYVREGMKVSTDSEEVVAARKEALAKILAIHDKSCTFCDRTNDKCELQALFHEYGFVGDSPIPEGDKVELDTSSVVLVRDNNRCIRCKRCVNVCTKVQGVSAIVASGEGLDAVIQPSCPNGLAAGTCVNCGQCVAVCPTAALTVKKHADIVKEALDDSERITVVQVAPSVGAALGEEFAFRPGTDVKGRVAGALRALGFDKVFDTAIGADMTVMEEAEELVERIREGGPLPLVTSCCPAWIKYAEHFHQELLGNISSCKSPHMMFASIVKDCYGDAWGADRDKVFTVSVMPCTAKKFEMARPEMQGDVDAVLTTTELAEMLREAGISLESFSPADTFDDPFEDGSGAGVIFGASGGVMEAALRTVAHMLTGEDAPAIDFAEVRGAEGVKEAAFEIAGREYKVAKVSGLANANALLASVEAGTSDYQFIEVMACPGGCVGGGGQPHQDAAYRHGHDLARERARALYSHDEKSAVRASHENPAIRGLYDSCFGEPGSEKAHGLLHTAYRPR